jgi:hypothetical protein
MSTRESDTATCIAAIVVIGIIICFGLHCHIDETLVKTGLVTIAGIAGFSLHSLIKRP